MKICFTVRLIIYKKLFFASNLTNIFGHTISYSPALSFNTTGNVCIPRKEILIGYRTHASIKQLELNNSVQKTNLLDAENYTTTVGTS